MAENTARPNVVVLAGPNGAGKTTSAQGILPRLGIVHFVNADVIARGLSAFDPESVAVTAGRLMLERIRALAARQESFAFETTLSARSFAPMLRNLIATGYAVHLVFVTVDSPDLAIARVADRVRRGGHHIPDDVVRRRYLGGLGNFFELYRPIATTWSFSDNSGDRPVVVAEGGVDRAETVYQPLLWARYRREGERK